MKNRFLFLATLAVIACVCLFAQQSYLPTAPTSPVVGQIWFNFTSGVQKIYTGATNGTQVIPYLGVTQTWSTQNFNGIGTTTNCSSSASPAVCAAAPAGSFVIAASTTSVVVDTTAVTANSQILVTEDSSLGTKLSATCNTGDTIAADAPKVTARTAGTSFTVTVTGTISTNPACYSYLIIN